MQKMCVIKHDNDRELCDQQWVRTPTKNIQNLVTDAAGGGAPSHHCY